MWKVKQYLLLLYTWHTETPTCMHTCTHTHTNADTLKNRLVWYYSYSNAAWYLYKMQILLFLCFLITTHSPRHAYCDYVWYFCGWGEQAGGSGGQCFCSHAAVMDSKTDDSANQAIYSAWLQNKKPWSLLSFFQWPFHPISQHMSFCPPPSLWTLS